MLKTIAGRASKIPFERPFALLLAGATAFAILAGSGTGLLTVPLALLVASLAAVAADRAMRHPPVLAKARRTPVVDETEDAIPAEQAESVPEHRLVRLRRADRHPDAPPRNPIIATSELGSPFMEIAAEPAPRRAPDTHFVTRADDAEVAPVPAVPTMPVESAPMANHVADVEAVAPSVILPPLAEVRAKPAVSETVVAPAPAVEPVRPATAMTEASPAPRPPILSLVTGSTPVEAPVRAARPSLAEMMDRLAAGLDARAAADMDVPPRPAPPALREALRELNRLAVRNG